MIIGGYLSLWAEDEVMKIIQFEAGKLQIERVLVYENERHMLDLFNLIC